MSAFNYYLSHKYTEAISSAQRFVSIHPGNAEAPYAQYLVAMSYYRTDHRRHPRPIDHAIRRRMPSANSSAAIRNRATLPTPGSSSTSSTIILPARKWRSAASTSARANGSPRPIAFARSSTNIRRTSHTPEALERLVECYVALGIPDEAWKASAVLGANYPDSFWYRQSLRLLGRKQRAASGGPRPQRVMRRARGSRAYFANMLRQLAVHNVVLVERLELEFEPGLGVLTGETGAGKSILLDALGLALGARADTGLVRVGRGQRDRLGGDRAAGRPSRSRAARRAGNRARAGRASDHPAHAEERRRQPRLHRRRARSRPGCCAILARWRSKSTASMMTAACSTRKGHRALLDAFGKLDRPRFERPGPRSPGSRPSSPRPAAKRPRPNATATISNMPAPRSTRCRPSKARKAASPKSARRCRPGSRRANR